MILILIWKQTEADVYAGVNSTEEASTEFVGGSSDFTEKPRTLHASPNHGSSPNHGTSVNENCNASTPPMKVFPQEVHHYHHHYLNGFGGAPNGGGSCTPNGAHFSNGGTSGFPPSNGGSTGFSFPTQDGQQQQQGGGGGGNAQSIQQLQHQMRQVSLLILKQLFSNTITLKMNIFDPT